MSLAILLLVVCFVRKAQAVNLVVPNSSALVEGENNIFPFAAIGTVSHYQQVYAASQFRVLSSNGGTISSIGFRPNLFFDHQTIAYNLTVSLSTTTQAVDNLSSNLSSNVGSDRVVAFSGRFTISQLVSEGIPWPFPYVIPFNTSFFYNPTNGNLLLDMQLQRLGSYDGPAIDTVNVYGDSVSRAGKDNSGLPVTTPDTIGMVTQFGVTPVSPLTPQTTVNQILGNNYFAQGTGGAPGLVYFVLSTTDLTQPLTDWNCIGTNTFDNNGNFSFTNAVDQTSTQRFYRIQIQ